ncbi:hypothetical protein R5R35_001962 [Gryllus longicercus]|uniref:CHK kinase-like domain-containing protein n=1 Tax=Gryllus longicercus TaxID=2509291 RepID=A0AAN9ZGD9_9ORTH
MSSSAVVTQNEWFKVIQCCLENCDFEVINNKIKPLGYGAGFFGEHRLAEISVRLRDINKTQRVLHFFIKTQPQKLLEQREIVEQTRMFKKEVDALSKLFVLLRSVLNDKGKGMQWTCKCFYTNSQVIVLEDITMQGFQTIDGRINIEYHHCAAVIKAIANLHAASLIFEETHPNQPHRLGNEYPDILEECLFKHAPNHPGTEWLKTTIECLWRVVQEILGDRADLRTKALLENALQSLFELVKPSEKFRNTVCHGDLWRNNIFFRGDENKVEARLVDFQFIRYSPPANDIVCFLHLTTSRSFRKEYTSALLSCYYDHLSRTLLRYGISPDYVLPRQELEESCEFYRKLGVVVAPCYLTVVALNEEDIERMFASSAEFERFVKRDRTPEVMHSFKCDSYYRERVTESVQELLEECVLKS